MSTTLENQLESAYAAVARRYEPLIADSKVSFRLVHDILDQTPSPDAEEGNDTAEISTPYVMAKATRTDESTPHPSIFAVLLELEAGDNAELGSEDGALEELFRALARPLFYKTLTDNTVVPSVTYVGKDALAQALTNAVPGFNCIALKERAGGTSFEQEGSVAKRMISATFFCQTTALAA